MIKIIFACLCIFHTSLNNLVMNKINDEPTMKECVKYAYDEFIDLEYIIVNFGDYDKQLFYMKDLALKMFTFAERKC